MHQGPVGVTSAILVSEQAPTMNTMVPALQCATVIMCAPLPLQGPTVNALLLVQRTSLAMPVPVPGPVLPPGTRASITMQGPAFLPKASTPMFFPSAPAAPAPMQRATMPPISGRCAVVQSPCPGAYMTPPALPMYTPNYLPRTQAQ